MGLTTGRGATNRFWAGRMHGARATVVFLAVLVLPASACHRGGATSQIGLGSPKQPCAALSGLRNVFHPMNPPHHGQVVGQVHSFAGAPLRDAIARVVGHESIGALTDSLGVFTIDSVPAGPQTVRVEFMGYQAQDHHLFVVRGGTETICVVLQSYS